jgi:hypothetical protein
MNIRSTVVAVAGAVLLTASTALAGLAQTSSTATSSVTINAGAFTASIAAANFAPVTYSFVDQTTSDGSLTVSVNDSTGDGNGWQVTVGIGDFVGQTRAAEVIEFENLSLDNAAITATATGSQPVSTANMPVSYAAVAPQLTWTANTNYGQGAYDLDVEASLNVPGLTKVQTYTSTAMLTIVTGP